MKIIPFYLPQFHNIPENDEWWGNGFTEWTNIKSAKPLFEGHKQPKVPINGNYYDLLNDDVKIWQAELAKKYGIYGFCYYHYWFNGKMLLEKPMEQMLTNHNIDIPFCICWANAAWTKAWVGEEKKVLIPQTYGGRNEWEEHFFYFLPFFKDKRYIRENNKPVIIIYRPQVIPNLHDMVNCWRELAIKSGLDGLTVMGIISKPSIDNPDKFSCFDNIIEWQPSTVKASNDSGFIAKVKLVRRKIYDFLEEMTGIEWYRYSLFHKKNKKNMRFLSYDEVWRKILDLKPVSKNSIPGAFVNWDNSPRFIENATLITNSSPEKFQYYLSKQIKHAKNVYKKDMIFMFAWNEWAEGGYLEPDEDNKYKYLEAIKNALQENDELN